MNVLAINRNARMLHQLKMSQYGSVQKNFQIFCGYVFFVNGCLIFLDLFDFFKGDFFFFVFVL